MEITNIDNGTTTTFNSNDFRYTLICTKKYGTKCNGVEKELLSIGSKAYGAGEVTALDGTTNKKQIYPADYLNISPKNNNEKKSMVYAFKNFQTDKLKYYLNYLKSGRWCYNDKAYAFISDNSISLNEQEKKINM